MSEREGFTQMVLGKDIHVEWMRIVSKEYFNRSILSQELVDRYNRIVTPVPNLKGSINEVYGKAISTSCIRELIRNPVLTLHVDEEDGTEGYVSLVSNCKRLIQIMRLTMECVGENLLITPVWVHKRIKISHEQIKRVESDISDMVNNLLDRKSVV